MRERGSAAVEFAMVLPLLLLASATVVEVAALGRTALAVNSAAREGAREAAVSLDDASVRAAVLRAGGLKDSETEVAVHRVGGLGSPVTVLVRYRRPAILPFLAWLMTPTGELAAEVTMRQETDVGR